MNAVPSQDKINKLKKAAVAALLIYLTIYYGLILLLQRDYAVIASDLMSPAGIIVSMIFLFQAIQLCPVNNIRRIMFYFFLGAVFYLLGDIQSGYGELITESSTVTFWGYVYYTISTILLLIGFFLNIPQKSRSSAVRSGFDVLLIMVIYLSLEIHYILLPIMNDRLLSLGDKFALLIYPILDAGLLMAILLIFFSDGSGKKYFRDKLMVIIAFVWLFADQIYTIRSALGIYQSGCFISPLWASSFIGLAIVALRADEFYLLPPEGIDSMAQNRPAGIINKLTIITFGVLIIFMVLWGLNYFQRDPLSIGGISIIFMLIIRQYFALRENRALTQSLLQTNKDLHEAKVCMEEEARTDYLTRLFNRRYIDGVLVELQKLAVVNSAPFSVLVLDIDYFKKINDRYGHYTGDQVLQQIAQIINMNIRKDDIAARWGGEEFIIILPDTGEATAYSIGERIRSEIECFRFQANTVQENIRLSVSIGVSESKAIEQDFSKVILRADQGMYEAKCAGRNRTVIKRAS